MIYQRMMVRHWIHQKRNKAMNNAVKHKHSYILIWSIVCLMIILIFPISADAKESPWESHLSDEEVEDILSLKVKDVMDPFSWITNTETYMMVEHDVNDWDNVTYWWNVPNIQMNIQNKAYEMIASSGYGIKIGEPTGLNGPTAMHKWGFNIPNPTYMGERPLISVSLKGVLVPNSIMSGLGSLKSIIFEGKVKPLPKENYLNTLMYVAPADYDLSNITFQQWVGQHWYDAMGEMDESQNLLTSANSHEGKDSSGRLWIKKSIITDNGLGEPGLTSDYICSKLQRICGSYYSDVAKNILLVSDMKTSQGPQRIMPYDLNSMNGKDAELFGGLEDPRASLQYNMMKTGYGNSITNTLASGALKASGAISNATIFLNRLTQFEAMESLGFDPTILWDNTITKIFVSLLSIALLVVSLKSVLQVLKNQKWQIPLKALSMFMMIALLYGLTFNTQGTYKLLKTVSNTIFQLGNIALESNDTVKELYGTGNREEKNDCELWLPYFNLWSTYQTGYGIMDDQQMIDLNDHYPEMEGMNPCKVENVNQNLWSAQLADAFTTEGLYSGDIYRVVDHFMAPRIHYDGLDNFYVTENENYQGNIQTKLDFSIILMQLVLMAVIFIKFLFFVDVLFNIGMLFINICLSVTSGKKLWNQVKALLMSMLMVALMGMVSSLVVWISLTISGIPGIIISAIFIYMGIMLIKTLYKGNKAPLMFKLAKRLSWKIKRGM